MKKFVIIAGMMAMAGALFLASPVSAQDGPSMSSTLNDDGSATVTGTGWQDAREGGIFLTVCRGADVTSDEPINAGNALTACSSLMADAFAQNPTIAEDGTWSHDLTADQVGATPVVAIIGCLPLGCTAYSAFTVIQEAAADEPEEEMDDEEMDEEMDEGAGGDEEMDDMNEVDDMMDDTGTDDMDEMDDSMDDADETEMMANTGSESGLLAVIGVSVLLAGLFAVGIGRRITKRS